MGTSIERGRNTLVVKVEGRVDGANAREFQDELEAAVEETDRVVVLDLGQLSYISSAGLRVILLTVRTLRQQDTKFAVCSLADPIREIFEISGFDKIIPIHASRAEAVSELKG